MYLPHQESADSASLKGWIDADASDVPTLEVVLVDDKPASLDRNMPQELVWGPQKPALVSWPWRGIVSTECGFEEGQDISDRQAHVTRETLDM
jgi:hypothetical protein